MEEPVRSRARLDQTKRLSNAILRRTVVNVVLFIVVYLVLFAGFMTTLGSVSYTPLCPSLPTTRAPSCCARRSSARATSS